MELLDKLASLIPSDGVAITAISTALVFISDFILRVLKTEKPMSIAWVVARVLEKLGALCTKAAVFLDKVLPQKQKELPK